MTDKTPKARRVWVEALMVGDVFINPADGLSYTVQAAGRDRIDRPNRAPACMFKVVTGPGAWSHFEPGTIVEVVR